MSFQQAVFINQGFGVPGEIFVDSPWIVEPFDLVSALASYNIIGATAYTVTSQGVAQAGSGGTLGFAGILVMPKDMALFGTVGNPLAATLTLPNNVEAQLMTMGKIIVTLPAAANIGDYVVYNDVTGALATIAPLAPLPVGFSFASAKVDYFTVSGSGLAVISMSPNLAPLPV